MISKPTCNKSVLLHTIFKSILLKENTTFSLRVFFYENMCAMQYITGYWSTTENWK